MAASTSSTAMLPTVLCLFLAVTIAHDGPSAAARPAATTKSAALDHLCGSLGRYHVKPEECASALCHDPSSPCASARDVPSLATLAARLTVANATATRDTIKAALSSLADETENSTAAEEETRAGLRSCLELYTGAVPALEWSARSVAAGRYLGAQEVMNATWFITHACASMVDDVPRQVLVPKENEAFGVMVGVASKIFAFILNNTTHVL